MATLPTRIKTQIEISITTVKPSHYKINYLNTLIQSAVETKHPEIPKPNNNHYQDLKIKHFVNHIDLFDDPITNNTVCTTVSKSSSMNLSTFIIF